MNRALKHEEEALLALLAGALRGERGGDLPPELPRLLAAADSHAVLPLLYPLLAGSPWEAQALPRTRACVTGNYRLLMATKYCVGLLREAGIASAVLKGVGAALPYPVPEYRKSGDVDLLLPNRGDLDRACSVLEGAGACREEEQHANHHIAYRLPSGVSLELHLSLTEDFDDRQVNGYLSRLQARLPEQLREREVLPGLSLPLLEDGCQAFSLLLHMLQHFLRSGFGLKLLCDWTVLWNRGVGAAQRELFLRMTEDCGLRGFSDVITAVCARHLGLEEARAAELLREEVSEELCLSFLREVFDAEEFGKTSARRMLALRGTSPLDYLRALHHQMRLGFPRAGRCPLLWPPLWLLSLARFLWNNRRLRQVSLGEVLKSARERGELSAKMGLFRR